MKLSNWQAQKERQTTESNRNLEIPKGSLNNHQISHGASL
ncbi:unnamed protein product [Acidithrix sp. C25]|nr:unnamed protein product [Acidithrix sp. C25]